nr:hypothetical protein [Tanacetum cinerariifolium]
MVFKLKEPLPETQFHAIRDHYFTGAGLTATQDVLELVMKFIGDDPTQADMLRLGLSRCEALFVQCARCRLAECGVDGAFCTSPTRIAAWKPLNPFSSSSVGSPFDPVVQREGLENDNPFDPVVPREGLENDNVAVIITPLIASHVTAIANGRATLSRDYILNLKDHKQYTWKAAVADSKWPSEVFSLACQLFGVQWTNRGESLHSSRRKPQSKGQAIRRLNGFLPGNSKLLPIEPSKVRKFEDLRSLVQVEFDIKAGSYTMRYNKSRSTTGWRPLTVACHLRTLRTLINGECPLYQVNLSRPCTKKEDTVSLTVGADPTIRLWRENQPHMIVTSGVIGG